MDPRDQLLKTAEEMRHWQKEFFRLRQSPAMKRAQQLERKFDADLAAYRNGKKELFTEEREEREGAAT